MPRQLLIALLALGTVSGFGAGFAHLSWRLHHTRWHHGHHASLAAPGVGAHAAPHAAAVPSACGQ